MGQRQPQKLIPVHPVGVNQHWHQHTHTAGYLHNISCLGEKAKEGKILILDAFLNRPEWNGTSHSETVKGSLPEQSRGIWGSHSTWEWSDWRLHSSLWWLKWGWNLKEEHLPGSCYRTHLWLEQKHLCTCIPAGNMEATLLKGIFMIFPVLPEKALKVFGMLYTEFMRGTLCLKKELKYAK